MKLTTMHKLNLFAGVVVCTLAATTSSAQSGPNMKMTTDTPASITTPDIK
jgi:hypothetical protein